MLAQDVLWCSCGCTLVNGTCARCNRRQRLSEENFGGLRERVLARDGWRCRACAEIDDLLVHHRRPGVNLMPWLITLCRRCHLRVHHTWRPAYGGWRANSRTTRPLNKYRVDGLLRELWREVHPDLAEQLPLRLQFAPVIPDPPTIQAVLFEAA